MSPPLYPVTISFSLHLVNNIELSAENNNAHSFNQARVLSEFIVSVLLSSLLISGYDM